MGKGKWDLLPVVLEEKKGKEKRKQVLDACIDATLDSSQEHRNFCASIAI